MNPVPSVCRSDHQSIWHVSSPKHDRALHQPQQLRCSKAHHQQSERAQQHRHHGVPTCALLAGLSARVGHRSACAGLTHSPVSHPSYNTAGKTSINTAITTTTENAQKCPEDSTLSQHIRNTSLSNLSFYSNNVKLVCLHIYFDFYMFAIRTSHSFCHTTVFPHTFCWCLLSCSVGAVWMSQWEPPNMIHMHIRHILPTLQPKHPSSNTWWEKWIR